MEPFKNTFDFGFITEDKRYVSYDIKQPLTEFKNKHSVLIIINDKQTLEKFKQTIMHDLLNFSDLPTCSSSIIFIGLHCVVFQVTFLNKGGVKT